eukprot:scaffold70628_cov71-Phaeocystis_antarctica.AAC.4
MTARASLPTARWAATSRASAEDKKYRGPLAKANGPTTVWLTYGPRCSCMRLRHGLSTIASERKGFQYLSGK